MKRIKILLIAGLFLLALNPAMAQLTNIGTPANTSQIVGSKGATAYKDEIWCVYNIYDQIAKTSYLKIAKNNGLFWADYYTINAREWSGNTVIVQEYDGELYFTSYFREITLSSGAYTNIYGLFKWDGIQVSLVERFSKASWTIRFTDLDTFNGELYVGGNFDSVGGVAMPYAAKYDGTNWSLVGTSAQRADFTPDGKFVRNNGRLLLTGDTGSAPLVKYYGVASYDGSNLSPVDSSEVNNNIHYPWISRLYSHPDSSSYYVNYATPALNAYCNPGKDAYLIPDAQQPYSTANNFPQQHFAYRDSSVYAIQPSMNFGPQNWQIPIIQKFTGNKVKKLFPPGHLYMDYNTTFGVFGNEGVYAEFINGNNNNTKEFFKLGTDETLSSTVSGRAYVDVNSNCMFDAGDIPLVNKWVYIKKGNYRYSYSLTDSFGSYMLPGIAKGKDTINLDKDNNKLHTCSSQSTYAFDIINDTNLVRNFIYKYDSSKRDIGVSVYSYFGSRARRGFLDRYYVKAKNEGFIKRSGSVKVTVDTNFIDISSIGPNLTLSGNVLTFTFTDLKPDQEVLSTWKMRVPVIVPLNSKVTLNAELDSATMAWDTENSNNWDYKKLTVRASYDPNDKTSNPQGDILPGTENITYHINFQNMGNDTAYKVVVVDTIDTRLPLEKISIAASSHPFQLKIKENILIFEFDNIDLVDSATNEPFSKGFVRFHAKLPKNLPLGAKVNNRAHIYFDYNEAIETNIASVLVAKPNGVRPVAQNELLVYPNPTDGILNINNSENATSAIVYAVTGKEVRSINLQNGLNSIDVSELPNGIYLVKLAGQNTMTKIQILH